MPSFTPLLEPILRPILRPVVRLFVSLIAIPLFRLFRRRVVRIHELNEELEKDVDQWFRGAILLLVATANMEPYLFRWTLNPNEVHTISQWRGEGILIDNWVTFALRLLLAMKVVEGMPDQTLFAILHPGMRRVKINRQVGLLAAIWQQRTNVGLGLICDHLNRSSPVFVILSTLLQGPLGWLFYGLAITQYLIIGLATSRDRVREVLNQFDQQVAERRQELIEELHLPAAIARAETRKTEALTVDAPLDAENVQGTLAADPVVDPESTPPGH